MHQLTGIPASATGASAANCWSSSSELNFDMVSITQNNRSVLTRLCVDSNSTTVVVVVHHDNT